MQSLGTMTGAAIVHPGCWSPDEKMVARKGFWAM